MTRQKSWVIGSAKDCDVVVDNGHVSEHHCRLTRSFTGLRLEDLGSTNGTFVNGVRINAPIAVTQDDQVTLGRFVPMPWPGTHATNAASAMLPMRLREDRGTTDAATTTHPPSVISSLTANDTHITVDLRGNSMILGRDPACDHVLDYSMVSWRHARIGRDGTSLFVEDLRSANGTFVNGERIHARTVVKPGDVIGLGSYRFQLGSNGRLEQRDDRGNLSVEARGIAVTVGGQRLLSDVSLTIRPSEFVGLMGPSGAGKSTLMNVLNGYSPPFAGSVLINGRSLYQHFDEFRGLLGYVPQDDIIHSELTVREALFFSARLRLPADHNDHEIHNRIDCVLKQLGLVGIDNVLIGSPTRKGISGGQRKRVNLAMELLTDPSVLFLDEPTSGLSSEDTLIVMQVLRHLANVGKTILLTIHQPSLDAFRLLDNVVVVSKDAGSDSVGQLIYYGPAWPDSIEFFNPHNSSGGTTTPVTPDALLRGLATRSTETWKSRYQKSSQHRIFVRERAGQATSDAAAEQRRNRSDSACTQWSTLVRRTWAIRRRDVANTAILLAQAPVIAVLIVMVFGSKSAAEMTAENWSSSAQAASISVFLMSLSAIWFGCSNAVREIVGEWPIYRRERMVNLRVRTYVAAKFTVLGGLCLFQCAALLGIVHWGNGLHGSWTVMFGLLTLSSLLGLAIGLAVSATAKTSEVAIGILPLILLPMVILGGVMQAPHEMNAPMRWCSNVMPSRWSFEGLLLTESAARPKKTAIELPGSPLVNQSVDGASETGSTPIHAPSQVDIAEAYFPKKTGRTGAISCVGALGAMLVMFVLTIQTALRSRDVH